MSDLFQMKRLVITTTEGADGVLHMRVEAYGEDEERDVLYEGPFNSNIEITFKEVGAEQAASN